MIIATLLSIARLGKKKKDFASETFPGQKNKEKVIAILRKHPLVLEWKLIRFLIYLIVPVLLFSGGIVFPNFSNILNIASLVSFLYCLSYAFFVWITWYYDLYILTDERIIGVHQKGVFTREVKEIELENVTDVSYSIAGFVATILDVGTVKTSSSSGMIIEMTGLANPGSVRELIVKIMEKRKKHHHPDVAKIIEGLSAK